MCHTSPLLRHAVLCRTPSGINKQGGLIEDSCKKPVEINSLTPTPRSPFVFPPSVSAFFRRLPLCTACFCLLCCRRRKFGRHDYFSRQMSLYILKDWINWVMNPERGEGGYVCYMLIMNTFKYIYIFIFNVTLYVTRPRVDQFFFSEGVPFHTMRGADPGLERWPAWKKMDLLL